jgi:hypothetical protein
VISKIPKLQVVRFVFVSETNAILEMKYLFLSGVMQFRAGDKGTINCSFPKNYSLRTDTRYRAMNLWKKET